MFLWIHCSLNQNLPVNLDPKLQSSNFQDLTAHFWVINNNLNPKLILWEEWKCDDGQSVGHI